MNNTLEIRWHGRGGQGAKTAALLLAEVAFKTWMDGSKPAIGPTATATSACPWKSLRKVSILPIPSPPRPLLKTAMTIPRRPLATSRRRTNPPRPRAASARQHEAEIHGGGKSLP